MSVNTLQEASSVQGVNTSVIQAIFFLYPVSFHRIVSFTPDWEDDFEMLWMTTVRENNRKTNAVVYSNRTIQMIRDNYDDSIDDRDIACTM